MSPSAKAQDGCKTARSSLLQKKDVSPNQHRVGQYTNQVNYGFIEIDWQLADPSIAIGLKNEVGDITHKHQLSLSMLQFN